MCDRHGGIVGRGVQRDQEAVDGYSFGQCSAMSRSRDD
jgi:hypothetical protein